MRKQYLVLTFFDYDDILDLQSFELNENDELSEYDKQCYDSMMKDFDIFGEEVMDEDKLYRIIERMKMHRLSLGQW